MEIWKGNPIRKLTRAYLGTLGRSSDGKISSRHREAGHKRKYRIVDGLFLNNAPGVIRRFEYDPVRNTTLALIYFANGFLAYNLASKGSKVGDFVYPPEYFRSNMDGSSATLGSALPLAFASVGATVYNIELRGLAGGSLSRAGGSGSQVIAKLNNMVLLRLPSGKLKAVPDSARAQIGVPLPNCNLTHKIRQNKAGQSRWLGRRPSVRGVAMNPVDHPHGGGEGRSSGGRCSVTPWGKLTKGKKTGKKRGRRAEVSRFYKIDKQS